MMLKPESEPDSQDAPRIVSAPRPTVAHYILAIVLIGIALGLFMYAYWGWRKLTG